MSDDHVQIGDLVDYYQVYGPARFRKRNGTPLVQRTLEAKIREFNLPVIRTGLGTLIDPAKGDAQLRSFERQREPIHRGRPRKAS